MSTLITIIPNYRILRETGIKEIILRQHKMRNAIKWWKTSLDNWMINIVAMVDVTANLLCTDQQVIMLAVIPCQNSTMCTFCSVRKYIYPQYWWQEKGGSPQMTFIFHHSLPGLWYDPPTILYLDFSPCPTSTVVNQAGRKWCSF